MSIAKQILLDELIEDAHHENIEDVIFWALEAYGGDGEYTDGRMIAYAIIERIKDDEKKGTAELQNPELVESIINEIK